ncbi:MAG: hypothetical protein ACRD1T_09930, partial [Acidimicrobiia bacterium]
MRFMLRPLLISMFILALASPAAALSLRELVELSRAGVSDEVLIALIDVGRTIFPTDAETLIGLKKAGLSNRVIEAVVRASRPENLEAPSFETDAAPSNPIPQVVIVQPPPSPPQIVYVTVPVPTYVPVYVPTFVDHSARPTHRGHTRVIERTTFG